MVPGAQNDEQDEEKHPGNHINGENNLEKDDNINKEGCNDQNDNNGNDDDSNSDRFT